MAPDDATNAAEPVVSAQVDPAAAVSSAAQSVEPPAAAAEAAALILPVSIVGLVDIGRLIREVDAIVDALRSQQLRAEGEAATSEQQPSHHLPKLSLLLDQLVEQNKLDLASELQREQLARQLRAIRKDAPRIHMSFTANPSTVFVSKIVQWLRRNIHPHLLVAIGLQPGIGAGCMLRTTNRYFDMSLGKSFAKSRPLLMERLRATQGGVGQP